MAVKIRLARGGSKKRPFYRVVAADVRAPRDGKFLEILGTYNPLLEDTNTQRFTIKQERVEYWLGTGAQATTRVAILLLQAGIAVPGFVKKTAADYPDTSKDEDLEEAS